MFVQAIDPRKAIAIVRTTRNLRWATIVIVLVTFPPALPQARYVYILAGLSILYNIVQHVPAMMHYRLMRSLAGTIVVDTIFAGSLIVLVGDIATPYSALLVFMILSAAYRYSFGGVTLVALSQAAILGLLAFHPFFEPVELSPIRLLLITVFALGSFGYLVAMISGSDQQDRHLLENMRLQSERERLRLATLLNSLSLAVFMTDGDGSIVQANDAAYSLCGDTSDMVGQKFSKILSLKPRSNPSADAVDVLREKYSAQHRRDLTVSLPGGGNADLDISVIPSQSADGKTNGYIILCEDITTERSLEEQRSSFISVASHELRTPLAILEAALESVMSPRNNLAPDIQELINQAHRNAVLLAGIIKDITMLAEAKNDSLPIQLTRVVPQELLDGLARDFMGQAKQKGLKLTVKVSEKTPGILSTERYIQEILQNYMTNAIKYSDHGTITLRADPDKNDGVVFSVQDTGIGISAKNQKLLFTKFFRAEDYRTRSTGGTGLGLYLCMEIAQRLGARLWCQSKIGDGSTFHLAVPPFSTQKRDRGDVVKAQVATLVDNL